MSFPPVHSRASGNPEQKNAGSPLSRGRTEHTLCAASISLHADPEGALYWPEQSLLVVSDLHFEKGSSFARRGVLLPPYDTAATLARLAGLIARYRPKTVLSLGDNFHDGEGAGRMGADDRKRLAELQAGREWIWITGNHDPEPAEGIGGWFAGSLTIGPLTFRHEPSRRPASGEIAGHLHPMARIARRGRAVSRRCFAADGSRIVMPAFGAYAGGLNIRDRAFAGLFEPSACTAHMLGEQRLYAIPAARCLPV